MVQNRSSIWKENPSKRGAAYLLAITALLVGLVLALTLLEAANAYFLGEANRKGIREARYMAEAGVDYSVWQLNEKYATIPYSANIALSSGSFAVTAASDNARDPGTVLITSIGAANGCTYTAKRVIMDNKMMPFDFGLYVDTGGTDLKISQPIISTLASPGMYVHGKMNFDHSDDSVTTGAYALSNIVVKGGATVAPTYPNFRDVNMPSVNLAKYESIANQVYTVNKTFNSLSYATPTVILVYGMVAINACTYSGQITIVSNDVIQLNDSVLPASDSDFLVLISTKKIQCMASVAQAHAIMYVQNTSNTGEMSIDTGGSFNQVGSISCNKLTLNTGKYNLNLDPLWNRAIATQMHMPGTF